MRESAYSAFGSTEPVYDPGGERIRWFCPWLVSGRDVLLRVLDKLSGWDDRENVSRLTVRVVSAGELAPDCEELLADRGFSVEARVPLSGGRKLVMSYIGKCAADRRADTDDVRQEQLVRDNILAHDRKGPAGILAGFEKRQDFGVEMVTINSLDSADIEHLIRLHREAFPTFPYDFRTKLGMMLDSPGSYPMVVVRSLLNQQIYAFSNLELNNLKLDDDTFLQLAEYDNTMRRPTCPDHGVIRGLGGILRLQLAKLAASRGVDLCHAESRAGLVSINEISYQLGMRYGGALEKHLLISGQSDIGYKSPSCFETMNVWYLNREDLMAVRLGCSSGAAKAETAPGPMPGKVIA